VATVFGWLSDWKSSAYLAVTLSLKSGKHLARDLRNTNLMGI
jgi:hypothetical protein